MHGVLNLLKPPGMTSHDAVALVRRVTGIKRVGHTGTLDPAAAGVLPICIGQATRLVEYLQAGTKEYIAEMTFGYETDTLDATGTVTQQAPVDRVNLDTLQEAFNGFRGTIQQTPPLYSAIKQEGKRLYELARAGVDVEEVEIKAREVTISRLNVNHFWDAANESLPRAIIDIECSGGTYIRSLVCDIGRALGCGATMTFLVRSRSGEFALSNSFTLEHITENVTDAIVPIVDALKWCAEEVIVDSDATVHLAHGRQVVTQDSSFARTNPQRVLFLDDQNTIAVLACPVSEVAPTCYKPEKVFNLMDS